MRKMKKTVASLFASTLLAFGVPPPTPAAHPVITGGLVNVTITDVLNNNTVIVQVPVGIAANVCDVNAAAIFAQVVDTGSATCNADADALAFAVRHDRSD
jgi:hypothetical protein